MWIPKCVVLCCERAPCQAAQRHAADAGESTPSASLRSGHLVRARVGVAFGAVGAGFSNVSQISSPWANHSHLRYLHSHEMHLVALSAGLQLRRKMNPRELWRSSLSTLHF